MILELKLSDYSSNPIVHTYHDIIFFFIFQTNYTCLCYIFYEYVTTKKKDKKNLPQVLSVV